MIKKIFIFIPVFSLLILHGCMVSKPASDWYQANGKLKILTTTEMIRDLAVQVGGDRADVMALIQGQLDPHSYELVKGDDEKFAMADLIFYNGLGLEHGLSLRQNLENNPKAFSVGDPIYKEDPRLILIVDGQYDPHIWMDVSMWMRTVKTIVLAFKQKDPLHAEEYEIRGKKLLEKMHSEDQNAFEIMQSIPDQKRYLVTSHDAFNYFARHYLATEEERERGTWHNRFVAPEGLAPDAQLSVTDIQGIIDHIKIYHINVLFPESNVSKDSLRKILDVSKKEGLNVRISPETLYGDAMGGPDSGADTYLSMIQHNVQVIAKELQQ